MSRTSWSGASARQQRTLAYQICALIALHRRALFLLGLTIEFAFSGDHNVGASDLLVQFHCIGNDIETWSQLPTAKTYQAKTETAGRARTGIVSKIATQFACHGIG